MRACRLYRMFDRHSRLLYVGVSFAPMRRLCDHSYSSRWFHLVTTITMESCCNLEDGLRAEEVAILTEHPIYNTAKNRRNTEAVSNRARMAAIFHSARLRVGRSWEWVAEMAQERDAAADVDALDVRDLETRGSLPAKHPNTPQKKKLGYLP
jgi:hypothetical protein